MWNYYKLLEIKILNANISCLKLRPQTQPFVPKFFAGQYLYIEASNGKIRAYSLASSPLVKENIEIHIYHKHNKLLLDELIITKYLSEENLVKVDMPFGNAYYEENNFYPIILIAGGYGFPPIKSILEYVIQLKPSIPVYLYWIVSDIVDLYMHDYLILLEQINPQFRYKPVLNSKGSDMNWRGLKAKIYDTIILEHSNLSQYLVYAYGSPGMVIETFSILEQHGVNRNNMKSDALEGSSNKL